MTKISESNLVLNDDGSILHLSLRPKDLITDKIIAVGDPGLVHLISQFFDEIEFEVNKREFLTHIGTYNNRKYAVMSTGVGSDNIEIFYNEIDALANVNFKKRELKPDFKKLNIIKLGISSSLQEQIEPGSYIVSDYAVGLDNTFSFYNLPQTEEEKKVDSGIMESLSLPFQPYCVKGSSELKKLLTFDVIEGNTLTCPGFYAPQGRKIRLDVKQKNLLDDLTCFHYENFWLTDFDMETAAHYGMARLLGHDVISLNIVNSNRQKNTKVKDSHKLFNKLIPKVLEKI